MEEKAEPAGALHGYRVVDVTQMISGPVATRILADQGADVIKVEPLSGDLTRHFGGPRSMSPVFLTANRSKRSVVVDLKQTSGVDLLKRLVRSADVFVQNFRPGKVDRLGASEAVLRAENPTLIYVSISGFGETGPYAHKRVYDPVIQGLSGLTSIQGGPSHRPQLMRLIIPDKVTALAAAQAITAGLLARERTGEGQHIRLSMLDAVVAFLWPEGMAYHTFVGDDVGGLQPPDRRDLVFETLDGFMIAGTVAHREWVGFCKAAGKVEWLDDPRFASTAALARNAEERLQLMASVLKTRTTAEWLEALDRHEVPCGPVLTRDELASHPQLIANRLIVEEEHPVAGRMRDARPAERLDRTPSRIRRPAPQLGEHTAEVLREIGYDTGEIERLRAAGVIN